MPAGSFVFHKTGNFHFITFSCFHRLEGVVETESEWTAARRGGKLPAGFGIMKLDG